MRKVYIKPEMEIVAYLHDSNLLDHSDNHIGAKGISFDEEDSEVDNNIVENNNLWDD